MFSSVYSCNNISSNYDNNILNHLHIGNIYITEPDVWSGLLTLDASKTNSPDGIKKVLPYLLCPNFIPISYYYLQFILEQWHTPHTMENFYKSRNNI